MKKGVPALFCVILLYLVLSARFYSKSESQSIAGDLQESDKHVTAEQLWNEFKHNKQGATAEYNGKYIVVSGVIAERPTFFLGSPCILLENGEDSIPDGIFCMFTDISIIDEYSVGESIVVRGMCSLSVHVWGDDTNPSIFIKDAVMRE